MQQNRNMEKMDGTGGDPQTVREPGAGQGCDWFATEKRPSRSMRFPVVRLAVEPAESIKIN